MKCVRCGEEGAERIEVEFESGAVVVMYLCPKCSEEEAHDQDVTALNSSSSP
jgi:protein-arginine kinase activator protein McsA